MRNNRWMSLAATLIPLLLAAAFAQNATKHLLSSEELRKAVPTEFFFWGQKAPVQMRNTVGFQLADKKMVLAGLVDASGYSTSVQQKYQGMLITETKIQIGDATLVPGEYGFGFVENGKFVVMDVGDNDVLSAAYQTDSEMKRPVPLKLVEDGTGYKLYSGRKWVGIRVE